MIRIPPHHYIHVMDTNKSITTLVTGPKMFSFQDHEKIVEGPKKMINIPPRNYCVIRNPIVRDEEGNPVLDDHGETKVKFGQTEVRVEKDLGIKQFQAYPDPFPLYPYEVVEEKVKKCTTLKDNEALKLKAIMPFKDERFEGIERFPEDTYQILGPTTYYPFVEEVVVEKVKAFIITNDMVVVLEAIRNTVDEQGNERKAGERWLHTEVGSFIPTVDVTIVDYRSPKVITEKKCIHLRALKTYTDVYDIKRKSGEEWLVTLDISERHIVSPQEEFVGDVHITALSSTEYCYVCNPMKKDGTHRYGEKELRIGEIQFFLNPGEYLESGFNQVYVLEENDCLLLKAKRTFEEAQEYEDINEELKESQPKKGGKVRKAGETWMIRGPCNFIPTVNIEVITTNPEQTQAMPLGDNEGVYVRSKKTGEVRLERGKQTFILKPDEVLWEKELSQDLETLIAYNQSGTLFIPVTIRDGKRVYDYRYPKGYNRVKTQVVKFKAPHNSAVQIFDYKTKNKRTVYGPEMIMLEPYEELTVLKLSGGAPKEEDQIRNCALMLGPDFMKDMIEVETADHVKLNLRLAYSWEFKIEKDNEEAGQKLFCVKDFVGAACKAMASRIRGVVSTVNFETFHKHSTEIITVKGGIFSKKDENGDPKPFHFKANDLYITALDIQSIDPVDEDTSRSLQKSVNLSFEIQAKSQEAQAKHQAARLEQESLGQLDRLRIQDEIVSVQASKKLLQLQAESESVKTTGMAIAQAKAKAEGARIEGETEVSQAELKIKADNIRQNSELELLKEKFEQEVEMKKQISELKIAHERKLANIEAEKFEKTMSSLGKETIVSMARAGPELQARLLKGLGLKGFMVMDGKNPLNLFNVANGFLGGADDKK